MPISIDDTNLLREIIMDHYQNPRNKKEIDNNDNRFLTIHMDHTDNCIDDVYLHLEVENNVVKKAFWHGTACAISTASTSILTELVENKSLDECFQLIKEFDLMMEHKDFDSDLLEEAVCFVNTYRQPSRINCATIGWRGLEEILNKYKKSKENKNGK